MNSYFVLFFTDMTTMTNVDNNLIKAIDHIDGCLYCDDDVDVRYSVKQKTV